MAETAVKGRLDYLVRGWGYASKKEIRALVSEGRISVNGIPAEKPYQNINEGDIIETDGVKLTPRPFVYLMMNKPRGFSCMDGDIRYPYVTSLIDKSLPVNTLFCVGRLDVDTEGLLLITNDGYLTGLRVNPESETEKTYYAEFSNLLCDDAETKMNDGITHTNGTLYKPRKLEMITGTSAYITVTEGRYHEVKRLVGACGAKVTYLKRMKLGGILLDENLASGEYRHLTDGEIKLIKR